MLVQPYWSNQNQAYIVPGRELVPVHGERRLPQPIPPNRPVPRSPSTAARPAPNTADTITLDQSRQRRITATLDGQTISFDPGAITNVIVNATSVSTTINLTGNWGAGTGLKINATSHPVTINVSPDAENIGNFAYSLMTVNDPNHQTSPELRRPGGHDFPHLEPQWVVFRPGRPPDRGLQRRFPGPGDAEQGRGQRHRARQSRPPARRTSISAAAATASSSPRPTRTSR